MCIRDSGRTPAFWFTRNLAYNHLHEIQRFADATEEAKKSFIHDLVATAEEAALDCCDRDVETLAAERSLREVQGHRYRWAQDNADIVVFLHALREERLVELVMKYVLSAEDAEAFQY